MGPFEGISLISLPASAASLMKTEECFIITSCTREEQSDLMEHTKCDDKVESVVLKLDDRSYCEFFSGKSPVHNELSPGEKQILLTRKLRVSIHASVDVTSCQDGPTASV